MIDRELQERREVGLPIKYDVVLVNEDLLSRELAEIFILKLAGCQNSAIGRGLNIGEQTVRNNVGEIINQVSENLGIERKPNFNWVVAQMYKRGQLLQLPKNGPSSYIDNNSHRYDLKLTIPKPMVRNFTDQQAAILYMLLDGYDVPTIAKRFKVNERTIKGHIYGKTESTTATVEKMAKIKRHKRGIFGNLAIILGQRPRGTTEALYQMVITGMISQVPI